VRHLAQYLGERYRGRPEDLLRRPAAQLRPELLALPGIGPETADSIVLYAAGQPAFVIDAYTRRICGRLGLAAADAGYPALQARFVAEVPDEVTVYNEYHALLVRHATAVCQSRPRCDACWLRRRCPVGQGS
jgi:endonuclease-3 related protein